MNMAFDYSQLLTPEDGITGTWREIYDSSKSLPLNVLDILQRSVYLPHDFYDLVASYYLLPSALCRVVPYLFLYGQSGSGKSSFAKLASRIHDVPIDSSGSSFAAVRNSLNERRQGWAEVQSADEDKPNWNKPVERNTIMVWDDIDPNVFTKYPDLYRMFKFGYDRRTDKIIISSSEVGQNLEFHCFCPKVFSSISPLHLDERFRELKRRLIVVPCKRVEELSVERRAKLGITLDDWQFNLIDIDDYDWSGFHTEFSSFWDYDLAKAFLEIRNVLQKTVKGLSSQQRAISLDLLACGVTTGIWRDEREAVEKLKLYWKWFKSETETHAGLTQLLKEYFRREEVNCQGIEQEVVVGHTQLRYQIDHWVAEGWLLERPAYGELPAVMLDLGYRLHKGMWRKQ